MDTDLAARLDHSIGDPPPDADPLPGLLTAGRRRVRRRRVLAGTASAAAVVVAVGGASLLAGGSPDRASGPPVATQPSGVGPSSAASTPRSSPAPVPSAPPRRLTNKVMAAVLVEDGEVTLSDGATVLRRLDPPPTSGLTTVALEVDFRGWTWWFVDVSTVDGAGAGTFGWAGDATETFEAWADREGAELRSQLSDEAASGSSSSSLGTPEADLVVFAPPGSTRLEPVGDATVLEQRGDVDLGPDFTAPGEPTAVALVRTADGRELYVVARGGADPAYISVPKDVGGVDLDAFVAFARDRYESGEGLL